MRTRAADYLKQVTIVAPLVFTFLAGTDHIVYPRNVDELLNPRT